MNTMTQIRNDPGPNLFEVYREHISLGAIYGHCEQHQVEGKIEPVVERDILDWISRQRRRGLYRAKDVALITGSTDAGRSAVACSIAEACRRNGLLAATFIPSAGSGVGTQTAERSLVATLAYQLSKLDGFEHLAGLIVEAIHQDIHIFTRPPADQLDKLILEPLRWISERKATETSNSSTSAIVMIIDGLQQAGIGTGIEGANESEPIDVLLHAARSGVFPFLIITSSTPRELPRNFTSRSAAGFREFSLDGPEDSLVARMVNGIFKLGNGEGSQITTSPHAGKSKDPTDMNDGTRLSEYEAAEATVNLGTADVNTGQELGKQADILGVSPEVITLCTSILKKTAGATPIAGLKKLCGELLAMVTAIQDKREVEGRMKQIIVDFTKITCIVCQHANRQESQTSEATKAAISELNHGLVDIRRQAEKMNNRGLSMRLVMGAADKTTINALRQRLATLWDMISAEIPADLNFKVTKAVNTELDESPWNGVFDEMAVKQQIDHHTAESAAPPHGASASQLKAQLLSGKRDHGDSGPALGGPLVSNNHYIEFSASKGTRILDVHHGGHIEILNKPTSLPSSSSAGFAQNASFGTSYGTIDKAS